MALYLRINFRMTSSWQLREAPYSCVSASFQRTKSFSKQSLQKLIKGLETTNNNFQFPEKKLHSDLYRNILSGDFFSLDQTQVSKNDYALFFFVFLIL